MNTKMSWRKGFLCVAWTDNAWGEPVRVTCHWPVSGGRMTESEASPWIGRQAHESTSGRYAVETPGTVRIWRYFNLVDGGSTEAIDIDREPLEPPKTRGKPVRWMQGRWEKLLAKGWVAA